MSRIVAARDGGLCRVKLPGGVLHAAQALAIADAAEAHASGIVELTNRANLQLRGVKSGHEAELSRRLRDAGLGPQIPAAQAAWQATVADDVRNLLLSPGAGIDEYALCDTQPLAREILVLLQSEPRLAALSPKFCLLLDGGERLAALDHPHDLWFAAMEAKADDEPWFAIGLAGQPTALQDTAANPALAAVRARDLPAMIMALLHTFLDVAAPDENRMRDLLRRLSGADIVTRAATRAAIELRCDSTICAWRRAPADPGRRFGAWRQRDARLWHVGGQPPLGRIDTHGLRALPMLAEEYGNGTFRLTPWQSVLIPDVPAAAVADAKQRLASLGFLLDAQAPLARLIACAGSTGCTKGLADTKRDALDLAQRLPDGVDVHLSGCPRSCAAAHCAPYTLLAVEAGRYDLYRQEPLPACAPLTTSDVAARFGVRIGTNLTLEAAAQLLGAAARSTLDD
ncbi:precorrin-3B synthase [Paraburkholderia sacchari]|uniref:precorrin-3B synthase n=1 Tax=Paraburkholderia sacchari TaxID=159450 RepID=UPI000A4E66A5|nr:precorrin-3B synthase [Paraburkholderia sacchari]